MVEKPHTPEKEDGPVLSMCSLDRGQGANTKQQARMSGVFASYC